MQGARATSHWGRTLSRIITAWVLRSFMYHTLKIKVKVKLSLVGKNCSCSSVRCIVSLYLVLYLWTKTANIGQFLYKVCKKQKVDICRISVVITKIVMQRKSQPYVTSFHLEAMAAGRGHAPQAAQCRGRHLEGRKYGILTFGRFWRIGFCIADSDTFTLS